MKKFYYFASAVLLALCTSCGDDNDDPQDPGNNPGGNGSGPTPPQEYVEEPENDPSITHDFDITDPNLLFYDDFNQKSWIPRKSRWELCPQGSPAWAFYLSESYNQAYVDTDHGELVLSCEKSGSSYATGGVQMKADKAFKYGKVEVKARFALSAKGGWPAIWMMPSEPIWSGWPQCGEIDIMEYYRIKGEPHILANAAWGTDWQWNARWNSKAIPFTHFTDKDPAWADKFHIWRMDWDETAIKIYLDDELLNEILLSETVNGTIGKGTNPFRMSQYLLLNLALGGINGGEIDDKGIPMRYEIDYVRVYQK